MTTCCMVASRRGRPWRKNISAAYATTNLREFLSILWPNEPSELYNIEQASTHATLDRYVAGLHPSPTHVNS